MPNSLGSSKTVRACTCRNRTWNMGHRVHARCRTVLDPLKPSVPAPAGTAPGTGAREYKQDSRQSCIFQNQNLSCLLLQEPHLEQGSESTCRRLDNLAFSRTFRACSCKNRTWRVQAGRLDNLASSKIFHACSCRSLAWNRNHRVHVLHLCPKFS